MATSLARNLRRAQRARRVLRATRSLPRPLRRAHGILAFCAAWFALQGAALAVVSVRAAPGSALAAAWPGYALAASLGIASAALAWRRQWQPCLLFVASTLVLTQVVTIAAAL